ncbi:hypothetical protein [Halobaculum sp. EA56]|uniref:hypothetical protein n=1 Tax=Halobaculum sp. EA56 TaxID=3421648 RepID=UPI003EBE4DAC
MTGEMGSPGVSSNQRTTQEISRRLVESFNWRVGTERDYTTVIEITGVIFSVDEAEQELEEVKPRNLAELDILERRDLQEWVIEQPRILGEDLLVITENRGESSVL